MDRDLSNDEQCERIAPLLPGKSRGGLTTKIVALVDALGNLARFRLLPGQRHDGVGVAPRLHDITLSARIGDKAFDSDWLRADLNERGVIPPNASRAGKIPYDKEMYKWRRLLRASSRRSRNSAVSPRDTTKPTPASVPLFISQP